MQWKSKDQIVKHSILKEKQMNILITNTNNYSLRLHCDIFLILAALFSQSLLFLLFSNLKLSPADQSPTALKIEKYPWRHEIKLLTLYFFPLPFSDNEVVSAFLSFSWFLSFISLIACHVIHFFALIRNKREIIVPTNPSIRPLASSICLSFCWPGSQTE